MNSQSRRAAVEVHRLLDAVRVVSKSIDRHLALTLLPIVSLTFGEKIKMIWPWEKHLHLPVAHAARRGKRRASAARSIAATKCATTNGSN